MKTKIILGMALALTFSGCASMESQLAKRVGCTEQEAQVTRNVNAPGYQEYTVVCKQVEYSCKIAPFTEVCNPKENKPVATSAPVEQKPVEKKAPAKKK